MLKKIIYIVGSPRSGSSLIYNAVCSNELFNIAMPENHLVTNFTNSFFKQYQRNTQIEENYFFDSLEDTKFYFKDCLKKFFVKIADKYKVNNLVLKSITLAPNINILNIIYPEITYIMTIRDPRDIIASMINVGIKQKNLNMENQFPENIELLCNKINQSYRLFLDNHQKKFLSNNVHTIKYENFVNNPGEELNKMLQKFTIETQYNKDFNIWKRSSGVYLKSNNKIDNPYKSKLWNQPLNNSRINFYKNFLSNKQIDQINNYCKKILKIFNYI